MPSQSTINARNRKRKALRREAAGEAGSALHAVSLEAEEALSQQPQASGGPGLSRPAGEPP
jgi:hypothetical protein